MSLDTNVGLLPANSPSDALPNGGHIVLAQLRKLGAKRVFLVAGESFLPCIDAFNEQRGHIQAITCRQESGAAYMAEAYGKMTGEPGICFVTRGPGASNATVGIHTAQQDSTPMIVFIGQVGTDIVDREAFQEIDYCRVYGSMCKWVASINRVDRVAEYVNRAWQIAISGRPGPVVLVLPENMLFERCEARLIEKTDDVEVYPSVNQLTQIQNALNQAKKPFFLIGGSRWQGESRQQIVDFAHRFDLPVGVAWRRLECYPQNDPQFVGHVGFAMDAALRKQIKSSDLIIALGTRIGEATSEIYTLIEAPQPKQKLIHIYPDPEEIGRIYRPDMGIVATVNGFAQSIIQLQKPASIFWHEWTKQARKNYLQSLQPLPAPGPLSLDKVGATIGRILDGRGCITVGAGNYALYPHRYAQFINPHSSLASTVGTMGYGLPAAVSYKLEHPEEPVVCCAGDGCFQMNMQELGVALQYDLGIVVVVFCNGMWGTIRAHQEREFPGRNIALTFKNPQFSKLIEAYEGLGQIVDVDEDFEPALRRALDFAKKNNRPALIELHYDSNGIAPGVKLDAIRSAALNKH